MATAPFGQAAEKEVGESTRSARLLAWTADPVLACPGFAMH